MPPMAVIMGTDNCTLAACVELSPLIAVYQIAYPNPDVSAPDVIANPTP